jgi:hypothetical protein
MTALSSCITEGGVEAGILRDQFVACLTGYFDVRSSPTFVVLVPMETISLVYRLIDEAASDAIGSIFQRNLSWVLRSGCATSKGSVHTAATQ